MTYKLFLQLSKTILQKMLYIEQKKRKKKKQAKDYKRSPFSFVFTPPAGPKKSFFLFIFSTKNLKDYQI